MLKSGERRVYKKDLKAVHPFSKEFLAEFTRNHPQVLSLYKDLASDTGPLRNSDFDENFDERVFAESLRQRLAQIPPGMEHASNYHNFMFGTLTFLFYPTLVAPVKENEIHQGRKRVDIAFNNAAQRGFFHEVLTANQTRALRVLVECKNYSRELGNPEVDQIAGRFGPVRGKFGIICCRQIFNAGSLIARCRDTALDDRGFIVVLDDELIDTMLANVARGARIANDDILRELLNRLTN